MSQSLSSLIVQRQVATMRQVEEALAHQVIYGGDLVTNLLEVAALDEARVLEVLAESLAMTPAPGGPLADAPADLRSVLSHETASRRAIVPLGRHGHSVVLAVAEPLLPDAK